MVNTFVVLSVVVLVILTSLFVYLGVMIYGSDGNTRAIRGVCFLLAVVFLMVSEGRLFLNIFFTIPVVA